jgi:hypothetical protein
MAAQRVHLPAATLVVAALFLAIPASQVLTVLIVCAGPEEATHRIYLSAATLVVVTPELIDHWLHQLDMHLQRSALSVAVVVTDGARCPAGALDFEGVGFYIEAWQGEGWCGLDMHCRVVSGAGVGWMGWTSSGMQRWRPWW